MKQSETTDQLLRDVLVELRSLRSEVFEMKSRQKTLQSRLEEMHRATLPEDKRPTLDAISGIWKAISMTQNGARYTRENNPARFHQNLIPDVKFEYDGVGLVHWCNHGQFVGVCEVADEEFLIPFGWIVVKRFDAHQNRLEFVKFENGDVVCRVEHFLKNGRLHRIERVGEAIEKPELGVRYVYERVE